MSVVPHTEEAFETLIVSELTTSLLTGAAMEVGERPREAGQAAQGAARRRRVSGAGGRARDGLDLRQLSRRAAGSA
jgi:hypothetical protein